MDLSDELRASIKRTQSAGEELANSISHGIGLCAALVGAPILLLEARRSSPGFFFGTVIFAVTMSMLYLGSTLYHAWPQTRGKTILRTLDHSAIFLLIAGTYTPFTLGPLRGLWGSTILALVWALAIFGKLITLQVLQHAKYFAIARSQQEQRIDIPAPRGSILDRNGQPLALVYRTVADFIPGVAPYEVAGGVAYTTGVLFFVNERLRYSHFIWHLFVLLGSSCHFLAILSCCAI